jgi:hypothetical protein
LRSCGKAVVLPWWPAKRLLCPPLRSFGPMSPDDESALLDVGVRRHASRAELVVDLVLLAALVLEVLCPFKVETTAAGVGEEVRNDQDVLVAQDFVCCGVVGLLAASPRRPPRDGLRRFGPPA